MSPTKVNLFLLEDDDGLRDALECQAFASQLEPIVFHSGVEGLAWLQSLPYSQLPDAYLLDMRIMARNGQDQNAEYASPLAIFNYVKQHGNTTHFRYMTGRYSDHDERVQYETSVRPFLKGNNESMMEFISELGRLYGKDKLSIPAVA